MDLSLIRWMLSLSPTERLQVLQENLGAILRLRREDKTAGDKDKPALIILRRTLQEKRAK